MRIAHLIASLHPGMGGLPKTAWALASAQAAKGHEVCLFSEDGPQHHESLGSVFGNPEGSERVEIREVSADPLNRLTGRETAGRLEEWKPQVLHVHGLWEPVLWHAQVWAARQGVPVILFPQSMLHPWQSARRRVEKFGVRHVLGVQRLWKQAACVQAGSVEEADHWKELGVRRTEVIPNGIFPGEDSGAGEDPVSAVPDSPFLLSLARLHPQKGPEILLEAFARVATEFPGHSLVFAGAEYGSGPLLRSRAREWGLEGRVHFPGLLEGAARWSALHRCELFALPSRAEGFSLALLEAALSGAACMISPQCYFDRLIEAGGGVCLPLDSEAWAGVLRRLLPDAEERSRMGAAARKLVITEYTWDRITDQLLTLYGEVSAS